MHCVGGERPSSGAASPESEPAIEHFGVHVRADVAAPEDGRSPYRVVKNSQKLYRFFTGFHFEHTKKSVRKLNKVKFQGFFEGL
jgi:hypothetical protein